MRIRSTKPEFWRSETIASLDWDSRLVLKGLESYVDDNGVGKDSVVLICADVFPHDLARDPETVARVSRGLEQLSAVNLIARYTVDGTALVYVRRWKSIQRVDKPNRGRFPRPDGSLEYSDAVDERVGAGQSVSTVPAAPVFREGVANVREDVARVPEDYAPGTEEQRNRGTEEEETSSTAPRSKPTDPPRFDEFWNTYPRRQGKGEARKAYAKALKSVDPQTLIDSAVRYAQDPNRSEQYTAMAATWLNQERWADDPLPSRNALQAVPNRADAKVQGYLDIGRRLTNQQKELA